MGDLLYASGKENAGKQCSALLHLVHTNQLRDKAIQRDKFYLEEREIPVTLNLSDFQVSHDDLTVIIPLLNQVVLIFLRACGAESILGTRTHH